MATNPFDPESQKESLVDKLIVGLERISETYRVLLWDHAKKAGLSPIQIQLLIFLHYHKPEMRTVSYLAKEFNMTKPTISDAIKVLHEKGLVEKHAGITDSRSYTITLGVKGKDLVKDVEHFAAPLQKYLTGLPESQQQNLFDGITRLIYEMNQQEVIQVQRTCFGCRFYEKTKNGHHCHFIKKDLKANQIRLDCEDFVALPKG